MIMIKPGDIVEWVYEVTNDPVVEDETLWSCVSESWCQIGSGFVHTCIACDGLAITWLNSNGLFHARVDDTVGTTFGGEYAQVVPRARG